MSGRDWLAALVGGADVLGANLNRRKDLREAAAFRKSERDDEQKNALALLAARARAAASSSTSPRTVQTEWNGTALIERDPVTGVWKPAMMAGGPSAAPVFTGHENDDAEHGGPDVAMGHLTGSNIPLPAVPVVRPPTPKPEDPPVAVMVNGRPVFVPRSQAIGKEPVRTEPQPNLVTGLGPDGKPVRVVDRPGVEMPSAQQQPPNDAERLAAGFADRMALASQTLERLEAIPQFRQELTSVAHSPSGGGSMPLIGNLLLSNDGQLYKQAQSNWVRANLRKESGAAIGKDEMEQEIKTYFPQPNDTDDVITAKATLRKTAEANMRRNAGRAGQRYSPDNPFAKPPV